MQSQLKSLSKIFSETIFRIPDYQRGYSWELRHLKDFWNDVEQLSLGKNHYTGVLTLEPVGEGDYSKWEDDVWIIESKQYQPLYIVDGQQRLTTAIILLQSVLDQMKEGEELNYFTKQDIRRKYIFESKDQGISRSYIFGYEKDNPSSEFLKQKIFGEQSTLHSILEDTVYTRNLGAAKEFFASKLKSFSKAQLETLFTKLTQNLQFNIFYIEPELDVFVTFETMNNRGKALSHLELLKNRLIYLSTRFEVEKHEREQLRKAINESWKTIYHFLGKVASKKFTDDVFLRTHFVCYFGPKELLKSDEEDDGEEFRLHRYLSQDYYKDYLLEEVFTPKRLLVEGPAAGALTLDEVYGYAQHIKQNVQAYYHVAEPESSEWSDQEKILLSCIRRLANYEVFLLAIAVMTTVGDQTARINLLKSAERMGFLRKLRPYFFNELDLEIMVAELLAGKTTPEAALAQLDTITNKFASSLDFKEAIRNIGKGGGYYSWSALRYFMYENEQTLRVASKTSRQLLGWNEYLREGYASDHRTIEHIYPQKASDPYWKAKFSAYTVAQRNLLRNSLGNLLPVSHAKNASLGNRSFEVKKGGADNAVGYRYGCLSEIQVSHENEWGALQILRRGVQLLGFFGQRWNVDFGSFDERVKLLGLQFVCDVEKVTVQAAMEMPLTIPTALEIEAAREPLIEISKIDDDADDF